MVYIYRIYQWCIASPIMLVYSIITALITIVGCLFNQDYWGYFLRQVVGTVVLDSFGTRQGSGARAH